VRFTTNGFYRKCRLERSFTSLRQIASGFLLIALPTKTPDFLFVLGHEFGSSEPQALALE
jgi:hypothetical protein